MRPEVLTLGEAMAVVYPSAPVPLDQATSLALNIAGAEANVAIALSRLRQHVRFLSRLGDEPFGRLIRHGIVNLFISPGEFSPLRGFFGLFHGDSSRNEAEKTSLFPCAGYLGHPFRKTRNVCHKIEN
jgi:hypothetical protein